MLILFLLWKSCVFVFQVKLGLSVGGSADVKEVKELLAGDTRIPEAQILLLEIDGEGFHRTFTGETDEL